MAGTVVLDPPLPVLLLLLQLSAKHMIVNKTKNERMLLNFEFGIRYQACFKGI